MSSSPAAPSTPSPVGAGAAGPWFHNTATGELAQLLVSPDETEGRRIVTDLYLQPGAAVAGRHVHAQVLERFEVLAGRVAFAVGGQTREVVPGEGRVEVPAGTVHDWWHVGDEVAQVRVEVEATPSATGRPADRFAAMIEVIWSLGTLGKVNAKGMPDLLWLAAIAHEFRDAIVFTSPPPPVQRALFGPLAALARRTGRDPLAPGLHGPSAPCVIPAPDEERLAELLARPVAAAAARGRR